DHIVKPPYAATGQVKRRPESATKSPDVIARMRRAGSTAAEVLRLAGEFVKPGITTDEIDVYVHDLCVARCRTNTRRWQPAALSAEADSNAHGQAIRSVRTCTFTSAHDDGARVTFRALGLAYMHVFPFHSWA
ncbi:MAG: hypothetical protein ACKO8V_01575, partial [Actinomycetota bacterium]